MQGEQTSDGAGKMPLRQMPGPRFPRSSPFSFSASLMLRRASRTPRAPSPQTVGRDRSSPAVSQEANEVVNAVKACVHFLPTRPGGAQSWPLIALYPLFFPGAHSVLALP